MGLSVNRDLLPLKLTLFFFSAAATSILPYLTIHMKDIGLSDIDVAFVYAVLPFIVFLAPPLVGFLADKMGNYTRVCIVTIILAGTFHTLLLAVPHTVIKIEYPPTTAVLSGNQIKLDWTPSCPQSNVSHCSPALPLKSSLKIALHNCSLTCTCADSTSKSTEEKICALLPGSQCIPNSVKKVISIKGLAPNVTETGCGSAVLGLSSRQDPCEVQTGIEWRSLEFGEGCEASCSATTDIVRDCGVSDNGYRTTTISIYFILRVIGNTSLALVFIMLDAQTIQMCKEEEAAGNHGSYGRQMVYKCIAQAIVAPLVGVIMDQITKFTGSTNYLAPFLLHDTFLFCTLICVCMLKTDIGIPKGADTSKGVKAIFTNVTTLVFLGITLVCGILLGFIETFLFVFLKEDLNAPIYLLGLTVTTGALISIPSLYYSDFFLKKLGIVNVIILALLMYGVRYIGYSLITCAWYAFPFETLEVFTLFFLRVAFAEYVKENSPPGTLATLTGMTGAAHFGFGKGVGGLIGGVIKDQVGLSVAFRYFGFAGFTCGIAYASFYYLYGKKADARMKERRDEKDKQKMEPFLPSGDTILSKEKIIKD